MLEMEWYRGARKYWMWWCYFSGVLTLSFGAAFLFAIAISDDQVWTYENFELLTPEVRMGPAGRVQYRVDVRAHQSCPGEVLHVMSRRVDEDDSKREPPATIQFRRPVSHPGISKKELVSTFDLPRGIFPGVWDVDIVIESQCVGREFRDRLSRFSVRVVPQ